MISSTWLSYLHLCQMSVFSHYFSPYPSLYPLPLIPTIVIPGHEAQICLSVLCLTSFLWQGWDHPSLGVSSSAQLSFVMWIEPSAMVSLGIASRFCKHCRADLIHFICDTKKKKKQKWHFGALAGLFRAVGIAHSLLPSVCADTTVCSQINWLLQPNLGGKYLMYHQNH